MGKSAAKAASKLVREVVEDITKGVRKADVPDLSRTSKSHGKPRAGAHEPKSSQPDLSRMDRGDGRDPSGRFTGKGGYGKDKEKIGLDLDQVENDWQLPLERQQVLLHVDGLEQGRYYDGLLEVGQDTYMEVEVKSGSASLTAKQREFDGTISPATPRLDACSQLGSLDAVRSVP